MKIILITGTEETDKDVIMDLALKGAEKILPKFHYVHFDFKIKKNIEESQKAYERKIKEKIKRMKSKRMKNLIINCNFVEKMGDWYIITVTEKFFEDVKPDFIILMKNCKRQFDKNWEKITETYILSRLKKKIKIIKVEEGNIKEAIKSLKRTLKLIMD